MPIKNPFGGRIYFAALALAGLVGCSQDGTPNPGLAFPFAGKYRAAQDATPVLLNNAGWWQRFEDPTLDQLVETGLSGGLSLELARERVIEAQASLRAVPGSAAVSPSVGAKLAGDDTGQSQVSGNGTLGLTWVLDPYGARREELKAARARVDVAGAEADAAQLLLLDKIATAYIDLRHSQKLVQLRQQEVASRRKIVALTQRFADQGEATRLETTRAAALLAEVQSQIPVIEAHIQSQKNQIAILAGRPPGTLEIDLDAGAKQPRARMSPEVGIPTDLLRNRPDIRIAEQLYYVAIADGHIAKTATYPKLSLSGAISVNAIRDAGRSAEYYLGPSVTFPMFDGGSARAKVDASYSRIRQAHTTWRATVLEAILEVENALLDYRAGGATITASEKTVKLYRELLSLTRDLAESDAATLGDLVDAEQSGASANTALADAVYQQGLNFVALNIRLGSGNAYVSAPPDPGGKVRAAP
ncbi:MAG: efflux transporter outer membrane subunit [Microgenomates group bacterium]